MTKKEFSHDLMRLFNALQKQPTEATVTEWYNQLCDLTAEQFGHAVDVFLQTSKDPWVTIGKLRDIVSEADYGVTPPAELAWAKVMQAYRVWDFYDEVAREEARDMLPTSVMDVLKICGGFSDIFNRGAKDVGFQFRGIWKSASVEKAKQALLSDKTKHKRIEHSPAVKRVAGLLPGIEE
jgi:hypothetical protein